MITSTQNNQVKNWRKLQQGKYREQMKCFLIEGFHLVEEAIKSDWEIETLIVEDGVDLPSWASKESIVYVNYIVFNEIAQTKNTQGIAAVVKMHSFTKADAKHLLLIDGVQDPGNLGTMIRTADAAGFSKIILGKGTVDLYNDKVIRATQGSLFHIEITTGELDVEIRSLQEAGFTVYATALENAQLFSEVSVPEKFALIMGNEGAGISEEILSQANERLTIPIYGAAESLNVSVAAGVLMYYLRMNAGG